MVANLNTAVFYHGILALENVVTAVNYCGKLPPFHGNTIILCYKAILPW